MTAASLQIGDLVGPYRILGELGGGGMGMVYRAVHALLHRPAAIKVLRPELGTHSTVADRFLTEARATTAIRHPGIVEVYDYGHTPSGSAFIAMELLEGSTLAQRIVERGPMTTFEALTIARRIAAPLAAAHERGIVHRDLKPDNVFLVRDHEGGVIDQVKILDFGIAKLESTASAYRTTVGFILGTPAYMAPEQCLGTRDCDHRADLYALGCILFEMLTGRAPYHSVPTSELIAAHIRQPVPELGRFVKVPPRIESLVTRLLAKAPDTRPRSALDVIAEIDGWFAEQHYVPGRRRSLRMALVTASGLALTLSTLGAWYRWWRGVPERAAMDFGAVSTQAPTLERPRPDGTRPVVDTSAPTAPWPDAAVPDARMTDAAPYVEAIDALPTRAGKRGHKAASGRRPEPESPPDVVLPDVHGHERVDVDTTVKDVELAP